MITCHSYYVRDSYCQLLKSESTPFITLQLPIATGTLLTVHWKWKGVKNGRCPHYVLRCYNARRYSWMACHIARTDNTQATGTEMAGLPTLLMFKSCLVLQNVMPSIIRLQPRTWEPQGWDLEEGTTLFFTYLPVAFDTNHTERPRICSSVFARLRTRTELRNGGRKNGWTKNGRDFLKYVLCTVFSIWTTEQS